MTLILVVDVVIIVFGAYLCQLIDFKSELYYSNPILYH